MMLSRLFIYVVAITGLLLIVPTVFASYTVDGKEFTYCRNITVTAGFTQTDYNSYLNITNTTNMDSGTYRVASGACGNTAVVGYLEDYFNANNLSIIIKHNTTAGAVYNYSLYYGNTSAVTNGSSNGTTMIWANFDNSADITTYFTQNKTGTCKISISPAGYLNISNQTALEDVCYLYSNISSANNIFTIVINGRPYGGYGTTDWYSSFIMLDHSDDTTFPYTVTTPTGSSLDFSTQVGSNNAYDIRYNVTPLREFWNGNAWQTTDTYNSLHAGIAATMTATVIGNSTHQKFLLANSTGKTVVSTTDTFASMSYNTRPYYLIIGDLITVYRSAFFVYDSIEVVHGFKGADTVAMSDEQTNTSGGGGGDNGTNFTTITISSPSNTTYNDSNRSVQFTISTNMTVDHCTYTLNGAANVSLPTCSNFTVLSIRGLNSITIATYNDATTLSNTSSVSWTYGGIDFVNISIQSPTNTTYYAGPLDGNFSILTNDTIDKCWYSLNGAANVSLSSCANFSFTPIEGLNTLAIGINATNPNGVIQNSTTIKFTYSVRRLSVSIQQPQNTTYPNQNISLNYSISIGNDSIDTCWYNFSLGSSYASSADNTTGSWYNLPPSGPTLAKLYDQNFDTYGTVTSGVATENIYFINKGINSTLEFKNSKERLNISIPNSCLIFNQSFIWVQYRSLWYDASTTGSEVYCRNSTDWTNIYNSTLGGTGSFIYEGKMWYQNNYALPSCQNTTFIASQGMNTIIVWSNSTNGTVNSSTIVFTYSPVTANVSISSPLNATLSDTNITLNYSIFIINDTVDTIWYRLGNAANITITGNITLIANLSRYDNISVGFNTSMGVTNSSIRFFSLQSPNVTSVNITPAPATALQNITAVYSCSSVTGLTCNSSVEYDWFKNGTDLNINSATLTTGNYTTGDNITASVRVNDTIGFSDWSNSSMLTIGDNNAPTIDNFTLSATSITTAQTITFTANVTDDNVIRFVYAEVVDALSVKANYTMTNISASGFSYTYSPGSAGTYFVKIIASDTSNNIANTSLQTFTVSLYVPPSGGGGGGIAYVPVNNTCQSGYHLYNDTLLNETTCVQDMPSLDLSSSNAALLVGLIIVVSIGYIAFGGKKKKRNTYAKTYQ